MVRPWLFGKTLNIRMLEQFFSLQYAKRDDVFDGLFIWEDETYRKLQGTYPVIHMSFSAVKPWTREGAGEGIYSELMREYSHYGFLLKEEIFLRKRKNITSK